jgi:hypothetical protein
VLVSGSINALTDKAVAEGARGSISQIVPGILERGGGFVVTLGKEPLDGNSNPVIFDWLVLEAAHEYFGNRGVSWTDASSPPIVAVGSEKAFGEIPTARAALWEELLKLAVVRVEQIMPGASSGALIRQRQAEYADVLITLGGATGVEHLSEIFLDRHAPVIPLDFALGASRGDGTGGSERLASRARAYPTEFLRLKPGQDAGAHLALLSTHGKPPDPGRVALQLLTVVDALELPDAFCVRLMNPSHPDYTKISRFFTQVVHPVLEQLAMNVVDLTITTTSDPFLNQEIFNALHFSHFAFVDITGARPNCFIELGYALGRPLPFALTCERGTSVPFDPDAIPRHEWEDGKPDDDRRAALLEHILRNRARRPVVAR